MTARNRLPRPRRSDFISCHLLARAQIERVSWKEKGSDDYKTRTEWHLVISWNKLGVWAGALQKGAYVEVEGELRYREISAAESDCSVRVAEIYANSILALD